jgi:hypothetical protein
LNAECRRDLARALWHDESDGSPKYLLHVHLARAQRMVLFVIAAE